MYALAHYVIQPISLFIISQEPRSTFLKVSYNYDFIFIAFLLFSLHFQPKNNLSSLHPPFWCLLNHPESFCSALKLFIHLNLYKWLLMITLSFFLVLWHLVYLPVPTNKQFFPVLKSSLKLSVAFFTWQILLSICPMLSLLCMYLVLFRYQVPWGTGCHFICVYKTVQNDCPL